MQRFACYNCDKDYPTDKAEVFNISAVDEWHICPFCGALNHDGSASKRMKARQTVQTARGDANAAPEDA